MGRQTWRGGAMLAPVPPAMVSCGSIEKPNILTVAWTGIISTVPPRTYISVRPERFSHALIRESGEFVINLCPASLVRAADFCGMYTGAKVDKFAKCKLTRRFVEEVSAPLIDECPVSICCRVTDVVPLGTHDMFVADIVAVYVDESLMDDKGKLHMSRAGLCAYAHGEYFALGKRIGGFGFAAKKKSPKGHPQKKK